MNTLTALEPKLAQKPQFVLYPNPVNGGKVTLSEKSDVEVLDGLGRKIYVGAGV